MAQTHPAHPSEPARGAQRSLQTADGQPLAEAIEALLQRVYTPDEEAAIERAEQVEQQARQALGATYHRMLQQDPALRAALGTRAFADLIDEDRGER